VAFLPSSNAKKVTLYSSQVKTQHFPPRSHHGLLQMGRSCLPLSVIPTALGMATYDAAIAENDNDWLGTATLLRAYKGSTSKALQKTPRKK
jgi:hypothetical protein